MLFSAELVDLLDKSVLRTLQQEHFWLYRGAGEGAGPTCTKVCVCVCERCRVLAALIGGPHRASRPVHWDVPGLKLHGKLQACLLVITPSSHGQEP